MATAASDEKLDGQIFKKQPEHKRGIPEAIFIENVEALCKQYSSTEVVARLQELHTKYQYMSSSIAAQRSSLKVKLPDIASALETVRHLTAKRDAGSGEESEYTYQLAENLWAKASAQETKCVCLWLGANVMLEYSLEEATELLTTNETNAKNLLESLTDDMNFLRDQITTTEVNIARAHNYGIKIKKDQKEEAEKNAPAASEPKSFAPSSRAPVDDSKGMMGGEDYKWKQDQDELEVWVPVPEGAKKGELKVTILAETLKVEHSGKVLLQGTLAAKVSPDGSTWTLGKNRVELSLEKIETAQWPSLFEQEEV
mmetsp:Transcript_11094/g.24457  ORF Transcript_11094/g.24457 Transcript_11094/m.24457 type:complete len:313 (+) Transcript_11094:151-1089(+)|eukprot:CAMPEP_0206470382 /NCGR_PEP_ID=MMETSP0324_2-20121206/30896_1 /ASSEMBLY_ACC=CAM_ASM_000836 /TAXON_ID=2866 /ORGANISM="Crypthecodinium cohnii, Strain Seligo" /LENGTH=312 /DNA_ID=CAMNT_0053944429 /DNA_START=100 /DNA_END=1038 /DNA_ORIENTATION=-